MPLVPRLRRIARHGVRPGGCRGSCARSARPHRFRELRGGGDLAPDWLRCSPPALASPLARSGAVQAASAADRSQHDLRVHRCQLHPDRRRRPVRSAALIILVVAWSGQRRSRVFSLCWRSAAGRQGGRISAAGLVGDDRGTPTGRKLGPACWFRWLPEACCIRSVPPYTPPSDRSLAADVRLPAGSRFGDRGRRRSSTSPSSAGSCQA